ncbi:GtrA family protein [uncultured Microbacterium sp.]|uniref:GtrA family protein n=1 Tax=uncultured Microbacterium sp. TaxID=191216 RepID=UPI0025EB73DF|nr:GtrA family protein [uncultured Microbacterium sp.]
MDRGHRLRRLAGVGTRFLIVGALSTLIEIGVFNLFVGLFGWNAVIAKVAASTVALVNAYFGNREWTFRHRDRRRRGVEIILFLTVNVVCTALGAGLLWLGAEGVLLATGRPAGLAMLNTVNVGSIVVVVLVRFLLYHFVVFRRAPDPSRAAADGG